MFGDRIRTGVVFIFMGGVVDLIKLEQFLTLVSERRKVGGKGPNSNNKHQKLFPEGENSY